MLWPEHYSESEDLSFSPISATKELPELRQALHCLLCKKSNWAKLLRTLPTPPQHTGSMLGIYLKQRLIILLVYSRTL